MDTFSEQQIIASLNLYTIVLRELMWRPKSTWQYTKIVSVVLVKQS